MLQLLELLISRTGAIVSRDEIREHLWNGEPSIDHERAINNALTELRAALRDSVRQPRYIETLTRKGYRFVAIISVEERPLVTSRRVDARHARRWRWCWPVAASLVVGAALALFAIGSSSSASPDDGRPRLMVRSEAPTGAEMGTETRLADRFTRELEGRLVMRHGSSVEVVSADAWPPGSLRSEVELDYLVLVTRSRGSPARYSIKLTAISPGTNLIRWVKTYALPIDDRESWPLIAADDLVRAIAGIRQARLVPPLRERSPASSEGEDRPERSA